MSNLKFLRVHNICTQYVPKYLPNSLRYLEWSGYPAKSLPCFQPDELVELRLPYSKIELPWEGMKIFDKLKSFHMASSLDLIRTPDFSGAPNLEELVFARSSNLCELHPSIGKLKKLKFLDLEKCQELTSLPDKFEMEFLATLNLTGFSKVKKIPEFVGNMKVLQELLLKGTGITTLPSSIKCLTGLKILILQDCKQLVCLPNTICSLTSLNNLDLFGCSKFDKLPKDFGNIVSLKEVYLSGTAINELPSSFGFLIGLTSLDLTNCKDFVLLPSTICSMKSLFTINLSGCSKFANLPENLGNLEGLYNLSLEGTAIKVLPSSVGRLTALRHLNLSDCKNLLCFPSNICGLKMLEYFNLSGCSKLVNLPENLGNFESLYNLSLKGTSIEVLSSSAGRLTALRSLDIRDCKNLACLPDNIGCLFSLSELHLCGNNFFSLPESISQLSRIRMLNLDGCKRLRSLPDIPSQDCYINVNNCTSLERLPESPKNCPFWCRHFNFHVECVNCFNIQLCVKVLSGKLVGRLPYILPGKEIPNGFEKANIRDSSVAVSPSFHRCDYSVNMQLPWSGFDELRAILLCVVVVPCEHYNHPSMIEIKSIKVDGFNRDLGSKKWRYHFTESKYGKLESPHLWLPYLTSYGLKTPGWSIDENGFHEVEFTISTWKVEVETVGFRMLNMQDMKDSDDLKKIGKIVRDPVNEISFLPLYNLFVSFFFFLFFSFVFVFLHIY
ncbi:disease resistance protein TAO1-like [Quercus lobata]|uniref:disease resistance protein TAO1-like n=1 Tax=Quercus lobata TaxID=97700 RepID=UPI0012491935|nr:disease resistance protein TAO1-like [Quercus lobata]